MEMPTSDHIQIHNISSITTICESPWTSINPTQPVNQPVYISLDITHDIREAALTDDLTQSVDYSAMCKTVQKTCDRVKDGNAGLTAYGLTEQILEQCILDVGLPIAQIDVDLQLPKASLRAKSASILLSRKKSGALTRPIQFKINELSLHTIIGINPQERIDKQPLVITLSFERSSQIERSFKFNFATLERQISDFVEASAYLTVEALASAVACRCLELVEEPSQYTLTVNVAKPAALRCADAPEIAVTRSLTDYPHLLSVRSSRSENMDSTIYAAIALGANLGDRFQNIEMALRYLDDFSPLYPNGDPPSGKICVLSTSFLYETSPMYVPDQPSFINCACLVETSFTATDLLKLCKKIEAAVGRVPSVRFGPRAVDLDVVLYGERVIDTRDEKDRHNLENLEGHLVVPHPRMAEREFVLRPLNDIVPEWVHPRSKLPIRSLLSLVMLKKSPDEPSMYKVVPFPKSTGVQAPSPSSTPTTSTFWKMPERNQSLPSNSKVSDTPYTMATLNVTPDSFSDGSDHFQMEDALSYVRQSISSGAQIIDIGGYSTRPGAAFVSEDEEIRRVVPVITAIRNESALQNVLISVDTFRVGVARAAIDAGANCINDVYAFCGPEYPHTAKSEENFVEMRKLARETSVPVIMMHSRGEAGSNKDYSKYNIPSDPSREVLEGVRVELGNKVADAVEGSGGLRRWQVIVDPGIGFSKTVEGNLELLRNASKLMTENVWSSNASYASYSKLPLLYMSPTRSLLAGYPLLIGTSRKSFLGTLISQNSNAPQRPAKERDFATAAAVSCAVQQGAAILRVHEVQGMVDVAKIATALWL